MRVRIEVLGSIQGVGFKVEASRLQVLRKGVGAQEEFIRPLPWCRLQWLVRFLTGLQGRLRDLWRISLGCSGV